MSEGLEEIWKEYPRCRHYEVSNLGRVRSKDRVVQAEDGRVMRLKGRPLTVSMNSKNRAMVKITENGKGRSVQVSHMVMESFVRLRTGQLDVVRHLNDDPADNRLKNLRFGTYAENSQDAVRNGRNSNSRKTHCKRGHELAPWNTKRRKSANSRGCKACERADSFLRYPKNAGLDMQAVADSYFEKLKKENT